MLLVIAWRNIWRNRLRSSVVIGAVIIGIWAIIFMNAWMVGLINGYVDNAIRNEISHIQIHNPEYRKEPESKYFMTSGSQIISKLEKLDEIKSISSRTIINGMLSAAHGNAGMKIIGIDPNKESALTHLEEKITAGEFLSPKKSVKIPILISERTAEKLKLKVKSNIVLQFQNLSGDIRIGCKVVGIYKGTNSKLDEITVYVRQEDLNNAYAGTDAKDLDISHEIAVLLKDFNTLDQSIDKIQNIVKNYKVESYREIAPDVALMEAQVDMSSLIFVIIIMFALIFGIINTMLMAVLERVRELGMLMAIGMGKTKVFLMIVLETVILSAIGAPLGMFLGALTIYFTSKEGIDLSAYSEAMKQFGMLEVIRPETELKVYWQTSLAIVITAVLGAVYPALRAIRLRPVEAIRKL